MLFNSYSFALFFLSTYSLYLLCSKSRATQNLLLLISSYVFYGFWDWRFLPLIIFSTLVDYFVARWVDGAEQEARRKWLLALSILTNLSVLGVFKYFNFFSEGFADLLTLVGLSAGPVTLELLLPVGISFYTFQSLSYSIDVYRQKIKPTRNFIDFALYVAFFPQLVAGPIERASSLLPQLQRARSISGEQIQTGAFLVLWGYFKKLFVADNLAVIANQAFKPGADIEGLDIWLGVLAFSLQIYCDFSGYSDIARGIARLMGIELMLNFRLPYLAFSPQDFWRRWHISLSTWLRDYLYIPLGGSKLSPFRTYLNLFITMLLGGLWHGAAWNFILWGAYHGVLLSLYRLLGINQGSSRLAIRLVQIAIMFVLTLFGWLLFRASSVQHIVELVSSLSFASSAHTWTNTLELIFFSSPLLVVQFFQAKSGDLLCVCKWNPLLRLVTYGLLIAAVAVFGARKSVEFIYFQF